MGEWFVVITDPNGVDGIVGPYLSEAAACAAWRDVIYASRHPEATASFRQPMSRISHGRHCICSSCSRQNWGDPALAPCGMHGPSCPGVYAPLGPAGSLAPEETPEPASGVVVRVDGGESVPFEQAEQAMHDEAQADAEAQRSESADA